jgi:cellulose synthase/poly-beta-1,6-N-acetylglucosamine synthase-like glycosyltransferase
MNSVLSVACGVSLFVVVFHYLVYPLLILAWGRLWPRPWRRGDVSLTASLITAAYNEAIVIEQKIENALSRARPGDQVIFISDGSTDGTTETIRANAARGVVALSQEPRQGKVIALNRALREATGDVVIYSDANSLLGPDAIDKILRNFADPDVGCVSGCLTFPPRAEQEGLTPVGQSEGLYWRYESFIKKYEALIDSTVGVSGCLLALRRELCGEIPEGTINDDVYLALSVLRQGYRVVYELEALCWELPSSKAADEILRRKRMTAGRYQALLDYRTWPWNNPGAIAMLFCHKFLRLLIPIFMLVALVTNMLLILFPPIGPIFALTLAGQFSLYALAALGAYAERRGSRWRLPAIAFFFVVGNLGTLGGLLRYLRGRQTVLWEKAARGDPTAS